MPTILIVDDNDDERDSIVASLEDTLGDGVTVMPFTGEGVPTEGHSYEHQIADWIAATFPDHPPDFIACDKELGLYENLRGLSATPVSAVASDLGIPFCLYSRQAAGTSREFAKYKRLRRWSSEEITLDGTAPDEWAQQIASLYRGFVDIRERYGNLAHDKSPPAALAEILEHPDAETRIALYGSGGQGFLLETLAFAEQDGEDANKLRARMPRVFGNWLRLSILRFPGILVNKVAARSYLNLAESSFNHDLIQSALDSAKYAGPFYELGPWWWREDLDTILEDEGVEDGFALAKKLDAEPAPCLDEDTKEQAGFYCMITKSPVSASNSRSGISWFPSGADLARIRKDKFEEITALVGMY